MSETTPSITGNMVENSIAIFGAALEYAIDSWQRMVLLADVSRQRGDQYRVHISETVPNVLNFPSELIMDGRLLARPVNYGLVRITPPDNYPVDPEKRPFVIVDPRAGNGPGIGGFKADSEIGAAIEAGHPCYFVGFSPDPEPGQTVEDVMCAEAAFIEKVISLHPTCGKPAVIGNCQAGWQVLMTAAMRPDLFGPIIVAGTPLSFWAGWKGRDPTRYAGGLLGGTWMTALASDLGNGRFDGATLVQNFENLDPANTFWKKSYHLYANIDTEAPRYLGFEKYWGGHVFLNDVEMQYIVDNLFVGNRLSSAELVTSEGIRLDLRNIRSPIVVFCSRGDNISPPPQALGWITDLYQSDNEILTHNQTVVYAMHDSIGHLGIFVSGAVGRKEHREFATNIELINLMPAGVYQAVIRDRDETMAGANLVGEYMMAIERRCLSDVRDIVRPDPVSDRRFAAVAHISDINLGLYRNFVQPWVQAMVTPQSADFMRRLHPLRISYEHWSSRNVLAAAADGAAAVVRAHRQPVAPDNPFLKVQEELSQMVVVALDTWRDIRDAAYERYFEWTYGSPFASALAGLDAYPDRPVRPFPGVSPEHRALVEQELTRLKSEVDQGGLLEAGIRALAYINRSHPRVDERQFNLAAELTSGQRRLSPEALRDVIRRQSALMLLDADAAIAVLPVLLAHAEPAAIREAAKVIALIGTVGGQLPEDAHARLREMMETFEKTAVQAD
ncbi:hypothetical protein FHS82_004129 [Pseudochelatococcus lubricantis]|uniref:3-hydroxyalkanoate synthetase n=1 Tax=Pseudochelatococcus lubricantis TaxID=1538102 RepID=A0ABX0V4W2_9HYPH|nr:DUF3141 domain-containing protein [Pseudochelatococcus lubricantis]NIJ60259.1 hypothetical protein [Pseudochelatococcus lubricantis]